MPIEWSSRKVSGWLALAVLAVSVSGLIAQPAYATSQPGTGKDQKTVEQPAVQPVTDNDAVAVASAPAASTPAANAPAAPPSIPLVSYSWTGFYVGVHIGRGSGSSDTSFTPLPTAASFFSLKPQTLKPDPSGVIGGGQVGFNFQVRRFVLGAEFDISASGMDGTKTITPITQNDGTPFPGAGFVTAHQDTDWVASIRPRLGVALVPRLLVYGTGGLAFAHISDYAATNFRPIGTTLYPAFIDKTEKGWIAGGGAEVGITRRWSARGEFLHYNLGSENFTANAIPLLPPFQVAYHFGDTTANIFDFGINFRF